MVPDFSKIDLSQGVSSQVEGILKEILDKGNSSSYRGMLSQYYEETPIMVDQFISDPEYLGRSTNNGNDIFPYWKNALREILHGGRSYEEVILSGSIGLGKSYVGCIIGAYLLYRLLCLKNPQSYYGLAANTPIVFAFFNIHKYLSLDVAYGQFQRLLRESPWFLRHGEIRGIKDPEYYPHKNIEFMVGCNEEHAIGKNIFFALLDEMSFAKKANVDILKSGIMKLYQSVQTRQSSRFRRGGVLLAKSILISSKRTDSDFLDQYAQRQKGKPGVYLVDEPHWVVKPQAYSNRRFRLAVGSKTKKSVCIPDDDTRPDDYFVAQGYSQVIHPPLELREKFEFDMDANLRDLAGISTTVYTKFIPYEKLVRCYSKRLKNPFTDPEPIIGLEDDSLLTDYFDESIVPDWVTELPMYIHLDIAYSGDGYGIGCVASAGTKAHYSIQTGEQVTDPIYIHVFSARIKSPKGDQVSLEKVRTFIYWLKFTLGWNIKRVSTDGFQSTDTRQAMITRGIDADLISLDKAPCTGYLVLRTAIFEKRLVMIDVPMLEDELVNLERNEMTQKVDHTQESQKDASDGLCGAVYNASLHAEEVSSIPKSIEAILDINENVKNIDESETESLQSQLVNAKVHRDDGDKMKNLITDDDSIDDIMDKVTGRHDEEVVESPETSEMMKDYYAQSMGIVMW